MAAECPHCPGVGVAMGSNSWAVHIKCGKPFVRGSNGVRALDEYDILGMDFYERRALAKIMREFARG